MFKYVRQILKGKLTTYQLLAKKLGNKNLARVVGNILPKNPNLIQVPCHRVVRSNGQVGNYCLGIAKKTKLLHNEDIEIKGGKVVNFYSYLYRFKK
ncbi:MAG: hypothetical protein A2Y82_02905 [Candidatus Buchananbacteria bacterium RBG_13_36_9]|uniref:Methylated-DNA-[protein]-cysteine S-methyltransferase DNA binding domain-containing protein n=1 Tax=Candidatus Buchananbacteria bacterium RBG_13_36_9 TaxID=1797530 RepID=A0A1G1XTI3_9BACT|nr:MAG: hypothetical protein A2Y82_02905 [Candidatus Buchananbacteria bacterium RBG_13_36_9]